MHATFSLLRATRRWKLAGNKRGESIICARGKMEGGRILRRRDKKRVRYVRYVFAREFPRSNIAIIVGETMSQFFPSLWKGNACKKNQIGNRGLLQSRRNNFPTEIKTIKKLLLRSFPVCYHYSWILFWYLSFDIIRSNFFKNLIGALSPRYLLLEKE